MSEWISVEDRLPENYNPVICFRVGDSNPNSVIMAQRHHKHGTRDEDEWIETSGGSYTYWGYNCDGVSKITHWQPLPEPPK